MPLPKSTFGVLIPEVYNFMSYKHSTMLFRLKGITDAVSVFLLKLKMAEISKTKTV
jgi:hypothetical protein